LPTQANDRKREIADEIVREYAKTLPTANRVRDRKRLLERARNGIMDKKRQRTRLDHKRGLMCVRQDWFIDCLSLPRPKFSDIDFERAFAALKIARFGTSMNCFKDYFQIGEETARQDFYALMDSVAHDEAIRGEYRRKMSRADFLRVSKLHEHKHGVPGMAFSIDCWRSKLKSFAPVPFIAIYDGSHFVQSTAFEQKQTTMMATPGPSIFLRTSNPSNSDGRHRAPNSSSPIRGRTQFRRSNAGRGISLLQHGTTASRVFPLGTEKVHALVMKHNKVIAATIQVAHRQAKLASDPLSGLNWGIDAKKVVEVVVAQGTKGVRYSSAETLKRMLRRLKTLLRQGKKGKYLALCMFSATTISSTCPSVPIGMNTMSSMNTFATTTKDSSVPSSKEKQLVSIPSFSIHSEKED